MLDGTVQRDAWTPRRTFTAFTNTSWGLLNHSAYTRYAVITILILSFYLFVVSFREAPQVAFTPAEVPWSPAAEFAARVAAHPSIRIVCEIGFDKRFKASTWLSENPQTSIFRFGDAYQTLQEQREEWRLHRFPITKTGLVLDQLSNIFHCDIFSLNNVTSIPRDQLEYNLALLRTYAAPKSTIVMWGTCDGCPYHSYSDHAATSSQLWQSLVDDKIIKHRGCQSTVELEGWCEGELVDDDKTGSKRPTTIPVFDADVIKELRSKARRGTVLLTPVNLGFEAITKNYECGLRRLGIEGVLYHILDTNTSTMLHRFNQEYINGGVKRRVLGHFDSTHLVSSDRTSYKETSFLKMMEYRYWVQAELLMMGFNVLISDADTSYARDPLPYFSFTHDVEAQPDLFDYTDLSTMQDNAMVNGGFYLTLSSPGGLRFINLVRQEWEKGKEEKPAFDDQDAILAVARKFGCHRQYPQMYSCHADSAFTFKFLDTINFPTGHMVSSPEKTAIVWSHVTRRRPIVVFHANGPVSKEEKLQMLGLWYYNHGSLAHADCSASASLW